MRQPNTSFLSMAQSLFAAFEARQRGDLTEAENLLGAAEESFHWAVDTEIDVREERARFNAANY